MKNYLIYFLLFSTVGFSQNYQYSLEEGKIPPPVVLPTGVNNQAEEIEYFKAYLLPISQKANLQTALDTYGAVRLEKGDYNAVSVVMRSNQSLYGHPSTSGIANIIIAAGSTNVHIEALKPSVNTTCAITFQSGNAISNCTLKTIKYIDIIGVNCQIENNTFLDITHSNINFNCSVSGYFRNNKIIKHQAQGVPNMLVMKGNRTTPSYGNVVIHSNYLTSTGETTDIDNLESVTFIGTDCETYGGISRELLHVNKVDKLKMFITNGNISYDSGFAYSSIDATEAYLVGNKGSSNQLDKISLRTNLLSFDSHKDISRGAGSVTGYFGKSYIEEINRNLFHHFQYNDVEQTTTITNSTTISKLTNSILGTQHTPWARPVLGVIPDPLGANWKAERVGKPDSTSYIQNLINTNGVADLPEGVFYISSSLSIGAGINQGIIGKGTGKTVICGLTDDFPLITVDHGFVDTNGDLFGNIDLAYLTLQGGRDGLYISNHRLLMAYQSLKYVSFREQINGIQIYDIFGLDNCFFEHLSFVNCVRPMYAHPWEGVLNPYDIAGATYMDKIVFYKCQYLNSTGSMYLKAARANNLNAWVDCNFDGGVMAVDMGGDTTIFANCDFTNFRGDYTLKSNSFNLVSCNFYNNSNTKSTLYSITNSIEGCNFLDNIPLASPDVDNSIQNFIANSIITGDAVVRPSQIAGKPSFATYVNSRLLSNPTFNKMFVNGISNVPTIILNAEPKPYPQFLVNQ